MTIAVGGNYQKPNDSAASSAFTTDGGEHWTPSTTPPSGYRSAVAFDKPSNRWITVGPNGTDISRDDGKNWTPLKPGPGDAADADQHWNAISLPFVVGSKGKIGKLTPARHTLRVRKRITSNRERKVPLSFGHRMDMTGKARRVTWDEAKAASNIAKHRVSFGEAEEVFEFHSFRLQSACG